MTHYDPIYGELLTSKEVSQITGFTMNQLRNQRSRKTSPFPFINAGTTSWYRKSDIDAYIQQNGSIGFEYVVPDGTQATPLASSPEAHARREDIAKIAQITTRNGWSKWQEQLTIPDPGFGFPFLEKEMIRLYELKTGVNILEEYPKGDFVGALDYFLRKNHPNVFWEARTYAVRSLARHTYKWDVTDDDIISVPIGDVPPAKID